MKSLFLIYFLSFSLFAGVKEDIENLETTLQNSLDLKIKPGHDLTDLRYLNFLAVFKSLANQEEWNAPRFLAPIYIQVYDGKESKNKEKLEDYYLYYDAIQFNFIKLSKYNTPEELAGGIEDFFEDMNKVVDKSSVQGKFLELTQARRRYKAVLSAINFAVKESLGLGVIVHSCQSTITGCDISDKSNIAKGNHEKLLYGILTLVESIRRGQEVRKYVNIRFDRPGWGGKNYDFEDFYYKKNLSNHDEDQAFSDELGFFLKIANQ